jgi:hypothetical protein
LDTPQQQHQQTTWVGSRAQGLHPTLGISEQAWLGLVAEQRGYKCQITGAMGDIAVHHLNGVATHPDQRWSDGNVIVILRSLHVEFHMSYMGGFRVPVTRADFDAFIKYKQENGGIDAPLRGYESAAESTARDEHVKIYRHLTRFQSIPADRQLWASSCNWQTDKPTAQVNQLIASGLIVPSQFHGVTVHPGVVENNAALHPQAHFHLGEWERTILHCEDFNPGLIVLETGMLSGASALSLVAHTMMLAPETVLLVNVYQSSFLHDTMPPQEFIDELNQRAPDLASWVPGGIENFHYMRGENEIQTYVFQKQPETDAGPDAEVLQ